MSQFAGRGKAQDYFKRARRYANPLKKEFDLKSAIEELKRALLLKPDEARYHAELGGIYLRAPELAITRGIDIRFKLVESASLAIPELEKAAALYRANSPEQRDVYFSIVLGHLYLGEWEKAIHAVPGLQKGWELSSLKDNAELVSRALSWIREKEEILCPAIAAYMISDAAYFVAREGKSKPQKFAVLAGGRVFMKGMRIRESQVSASQRDEARKYLERAIAYRDKAKPGEAKGEFDKTFGLATGYAWWYQTMCEFGSLPVPINYSLVK